MQRKDPIMETSKKPKRSYTREFLLSLSELEVCRKLPKGFDKSLLSEFEDASYGSQDRLRGVGSSSLQGFRRTDYGSSVPTRGDLGGHSRGLHRWDSRSSGRSDTDLDSEPGRRYGSFTRRSGQQPEHDGLLGSGSFPRPTGYAVGVSSPRFRPNSNLHHNRSNEAYQPPRPFKAMPHSRSRAKDSYNDETFGPTDCANEDQVEEERKRRAEFELMRKEQQKVFEEKHKLNSSKTEDSLSDTTEPLANPTSGKMSNDSDKVLKQAQQDVSGKSVSQQTHSSRPLVPPGFVNSTVDKISTVETQMHGGSLEVGKIELENSNQDMKSTGHERDSRQLQCVTIPAASESENVVDVPSILHGAEKLKKSSLKDVSEVLENSEILWLDPGITGQKILGESGRSMSILEKLFGSALTAGDDGASSIVEDQDAKADDTRNPNELQLKFANWFLEEDKKTLGEISQGKPHDLLALVAGSEKVGSDVSDVTTMGPVLPPETMVTHVASKSGAANLTAGISELFSSSNDSEQKPAVLTCEDLEQSILLEMGVNNSHSQPVELEALAVVEKAACCGTDVDNGASQHLFSLLQMGMGSQNLVSTSAVEEGFLKKPCDPQVGESDSIQENINAIAEGLNSSGKTLTLEALFGAAFMDELHSAQQNSVGSVRTDAKEPPGLPFLSSDGALFPSAMNEIGNGMGCSDGSIFLLNDGVAKLDNASHLLGIHRHEKGLEFSDPQAEVDLKFGGLDKGIEVRLPGENRWIVLNDCINSQNSIFLHDLSSSRTDLLRASNASINVMEKLALLGGALEDERSNIRGRDSLLFHGPHEMVRPELSYENLHPRASSSHLHSSQPNLGRPLFDPLNPLDSNVDPHVKLIPPDSPVCHLPVNMGHPPLPYHSAGHQGSDHLIPPPILQQMHMAGNLPTHLTGAFPGGVSTPPHSSHNPTAYLQERNLMQRFPFGLRLPNFGGPGMRTPGPEFGGAYNPPVAFQSLLEMELGGNPKPVHPWVAASHGRPIYGPELDMGFRYR